MPIEVELPDGRVVEFPDGTDNATMERALSQFSAQPQQRSPQPMPPPVDPTAGMSRFERFAAGIGKSAMDTYRGAKQAGTSAIRHLADNPTQTADNVVTRWADQSLARQQAEIDEARKIDAPLMDDGWGMAGNIAGYGAQILLPAAGARSVPGLARTLLPQTVKGNAAQGAVLGGIQPVATGENRLANMAFGGTFGAGGALVGNRLSALAQRSKGAIEPHVREVFDAAKERGIHLMPGQISESRPMRIAQSMLRSVPFTGAKGRYDQQVAAFNRELARTVGEDAPVLNSQVYGAAKQRQSEQFAELTARNALKVNPRLVQQLTDVSNDSRMAGDQISQQVQSAIDGLYAQAVTGPDGVTIPGAAYQAFDSQLGQIMRGGGAPAHYLGRVQRAVRDAMDESISPEDAAAWRKLRTEYGNRKTLAPLVAKANDGPISPPQVLGAVTNNRASKERMASGSRGELGELARIGQRLKEPPSSLSAERMIVGSGLVGGASGAVGAGVVDPATGLLTLGALNLLSRGMDSKMLARFMMRENPGMTLEAAEQIIRRSANPVGQNRASSRPLEIDVAGGRPVPREVLEAELRELGL